MIASVISSPAVQPSVESDCKMPQSVLAQGDQSFIKLSHVSCYQIDQQVKLLHLQAETDALLHQLELLKQRKQF